MAKVTDELTSQVLYVKTARDFRSTETMDFQVTI